MRDSLERLRKMPVLPPSVKAFLIADSVFQELSGKWYLMGVFTRIRAAQFPVVMKSFGLFVILTDAAGSFKVKVECCDASDRVIGVFEGVEVTIKNRLEDIHLGLQTQNLTLPAPGKFVFKLYFDDVLVPSDISIHAELRA